MVCFSGTFSASGISGELSDMFMFRKSWKFISSLFILFLVESIFVNDKKSLSLRDGVEISGFKVICFLGVSNLNVASLNIK